MAHTPVPSEPAYDSHFAAVGRLVDTWAMLEFHIDQAIWQLADVEQMLGACITAQLVGVNGRLRALRSLCAVLGASQHCLKAIGTFAGSLSGLQIARHRAAHDPRMVHAATGALERLQITADNALVFGFQPEDDESLRATRQQIAAKIEDFKILIELVFKDLNSLPGASQPTLRRIVPVKKDADDQANDTSKPQT